MLWSFRTLATLSLDSSRLLNVSSQTNSPEDKRASAPSGDAFSAPAIELTNPEFEQGNSSNTQSWSCQCDYQQIDFCPYCDYDQTIRASIRVETLPTSPVVTDVQLGSASRPRKLRKSRHDYQQLQYEPLNLEAVISARPDSFLSTHSRTPLLNTALPSSPNYLPLPPHRRTSNKLEKREKRRRSGSMPNTNSAFISLSDSGPNIPRRMKSKAFQRAKSVSSFGPRPKPMSSSIDTNALVSLAWTGEVLSPVRSSEFILSTNDGSSSQAYFSLNPSLNSRTSSFIGRPGAGIESESSATWGSSQNRRSVLRKTREPEDPKPPVQRPWTLAMAITDDGITDENLVDDLEDMRIKNEAPEPERPHELPLGLGPPPSFENLHDSCAEYPLQPGETEQEDCSSPSDSSWNAARQALLLCREIVRTERSYLSSLRTLIKNGTTTPPPPLMLSYLPGLITASDGLLQLMEENPSVQGVSEAFLANKDTLGEAFISWCSVVGQFFKSDDGARNKSHSEENPEPSPSRKVINRRSRATSSRSPSAESGLSIVILEPNKIRRNSKSRPTVRDLAILPTQRIMRYVLLFKELHCLTPTTLPSFVIVEQAVQAAHYIAHKSNKAQGHSAFKPSPS